MDAAMNNSDLRRMLNVLQLNRIALENDRKSYEKVKRDIKVVQDLLTILRERWGSTLRKLAQLAEAIALKATDIGLQKIKLRVLTERCNELQDYLQQKSNRGEFSYHRLTVQLGKRLEKVEQFMIEWNSASEGENYRKFLLDFACELYKAQMAAKERQVASIVIPMRKLEEGEREKSELERKYKSSLGDIKEEENKIRLEIKETESKISSLKKERKEVKKPSSEASRLSQQISKTRDSIAFWENRVSEIENEWLKNKRSSGKPKSLGCSEPARPNFRCHVSAPSPAVPKEAPPTKVPALDPHFEVEEISKENCEGFENSFNGTSSSNPRTFQFKKKDPGTTSTKA